MFTVIVSVVIDLTLADWLFSSNVPYCFDTLKEIISPTVKSWGAVNVTVVVAPNEMEDIRL